MPSQLVGTHDLLACARALEQEGQRFALLDSPSGSDAARFSHLCVLGDPILDAVPDTEHGEHVCLATFEHGLHLHGIESRHASALGFRLASYPVRARCTLDQRTGQLTTVGERALLEDPGPPPDPTPVRCGPLKATHDEASFVEMVEAAQAYIADGHSYQVNLSTRLQAPIQGNPSSLFSTLRETNPSPYQALLSTPEATLVSASPELLVRVEGQALSTRPIAGTRPRGATPEQDAELAAELTRDIKERAEHMMLVDLARNDLGRVARFGSVHVPELGVIERYSHVMHLVSQVQAELAQGRTGWDAFEAVFPCGTISGAPKRRSLEIIDELEPVARGPYTGSLGLVTPDTQVWNILIRTAVLQDGVAQVQAGAGIVADSVPAREHQECLDKARALLVAMGAAEVG